MTDDVRNRIAAEVNAYFAHHGHNARFYLHTMASRSGASFDEVREVLEDLTKPQPPVVVRKAEIACPRCEDVPVGGMERFPEEQIGRDVLCEECGHEFEVSEDDLIPVFTSFVGVR